MYRVFHKKTAPFIFGYNSYNNEPIFVQFVANVHSLGNTDSTAIGLWGIYDKYSLQKQSNQRQREYNAEQVAMQSIQNSQTLKKGQ